MRSVRTGSFPLQEASWRFTILRSKGFVPALLLEEAALSHSVISFSGFSCFGC